MLHELSLESNVERYQDLKRWDHRIETALLSLSKHLLIKNNAKSDWCIGYGE